jgi:hypothetical protein
MVEPSSLASLWHSRSSTLHAIIDITATSNGDMNRSRSVSGADVPASTTNTAITFARVANTLAGHSAPCKFRCAASTNTHRFSGTRHIRALFPSNN